MQTVQPSSPEELAAALREATAAKQRIRLGGAFSKDGMGGPMTPADVTISTAAMTRVLNYEPNDLTVSVEAGMRWADLVHLLAKNNQMVPLDPPFIDTATVGGVLASNCSGPRRRLYGSGRDLTIGMKFATLEGKLVQSGGMVVKNVAGLDMAKLMIGSFGTLAAIAVANFKLTPIPPGTRTFVMRFAAAEQAMFARDRVLDSVLNPAALDILNPAAAARCGLDGYCLVVHASGVASVLDRYSAELTGAETLTADRERALWQAIREFTPLFLREFPGGVVLRISTTLTGVAAALQERTGPVLARAGTGVVYVYDDTPDRITFNGSRGAIEFAPEANKAQMDLWPNPGTDFEVMKRIKNLFDPAGLLNHGRLYGRI